MPRVGHVLIRLLWVLERNLPPLLVFLYVQQRTCCDGQLPETDHVGGHRRPLARRCDVGEAGARAATATAAGTAPLGASTAAAFAAAALASAAPPPSSAHDERAY